MYIHSEDETYWWFMLTASAKDNRDAIGWVFNDQKYIGIWYSGELVFVTISWVIVCVYIRKSQLKL